MQAMKLKLLERIWYTTHVIRNYHFYDPIWIMNARRNMIQKSNGRWRKVRKPLHELTPELYRRWYRGWSLPTVSAHILILRDRRIDTMMYAFIDTQLRALYFLQFLLDNFSTIFGKWSRVVRTIYVFMQFDL